MAVREDPLLGTGPKGGGPKMNGDEFADAVRDGYLSTLTGYGDSIRAEGVVPTASTVVVTKPANRGGLQQALATSRMVAATGSALCLL